MLKKLFPPGSVFSAFAACVITLYLLYPAARVTNPRITSWDNLGYYLYLPQTFIEHDPGVHDLTILERARTQYDLAPMLYQVHEVPNGNHITQYPIGMACFYLPGFMAGHALAKISGAETDGYSPPYQYAQLWSSVIFCMAGIWVLRKLLKRYFSDFTTAVLLLVTFFGTNYFIYATGGYGTPHTYIFFAMAMAIALTIRWHEKPSTGNSLALGFILGLMAVTRPTETLVCMIPLLWNVYTFSDLKNKIRFQLTANRKYLLLVLAGFVLLPLAQMAYWKLYTGRFLYYSYRNPGEGFEFLHPHTLDFLFSFRKGWFVYTPLMLPAVLGLFFMHQRPAPYRLAFMVFTCINIYVLSCWSNWWYATSFGQRAVIQSYPVYIFGLGILLDRLQNNLTWKAITLFFTALLCVLNLFQIRQVDKGILPLDRITKDYYLATFGATEPIQGTDSLLLVDRSVQLSDTLPHAQWYKPARKFFVLRNSFFIEQGKQYGPVTFDIPYSEITSKDHAWIKVSLEIKIPDSIQQHPLRLSCCMMNKRNQAYAWNEIDLTAKLHPDENGWSGFSFFYLTPELRLTSDKLHVQFENPGRCKFLVRAFKLEVFERKVQH